MRIKKKKKKTSWYIKKENMKIEKSITKYILMKFDHYILDRKDFNN